MGALYSWPLKKGGWDSQEQTTSSSTSVQWRSVPRVMWHGHKDRVIELHNLLPAEALLSSPDVSGYVNGLGVIFIATEDGFFTVDPKSNKAVKVGDGIACCMREGDVDIGYGHNFYIVVPYTGFYFPGTSKPSQLLYLPAFRLSILVL